MRRGALRAVSVLCGVCACVAAGCQSDANTAAGVDASGSVGVATLQDEAPAEAFERLPVVQVLTPWGSAGSAIRLNDRYLLTARHVLPRRGDELEIMGKARRFERVAIGEGAGSANDWALIRLAEDLPTADPRRGEMEPRATLGASRGLDEGQRVYLVGYWRGPERWPSRTRLRSLDTSVIPARIVEMADTPGFPRQALFFATTDAGAVFPGASGGPAVVWDRREQRLKIVGIYVGAGEYAITGDEPASVPGTGTGSDEAKTGQVDGRRAQIIRRLPDCAWRMLDGEPATPAIDRGVGVDSDSRTIR